MEIIVKDSLRMSVEAGSGGQQTVLYDAKNNPSIVNIIPKFRMEDIDSALGSGVHPAFIKGGVEKSEIFVSTYKNIILNGCGVSMPGQKFSIVTRAAARAACVAKGAGWHLLTDHEWAAIALWCAKNNYVPHGNTNYGRSHKALYETGRRWDGRTPGDTASGGQPQTLTGSGPKEWNHDLSPNGIADMVGSYWEHVDLLELRDGRVYAPIDNNFDLAEEDWPAQDIYFNAPSAGGDQGVDLGAPKLAGSVTNATGNNASASVTWAQLANESGYTTPALAKQLMIAPIEPAGGSALSLLSEGRLWMRNTGKRIALRAGYYSYGSISGLGFLHMYSGETRTFAFRSAFIN